MLISRLLFGLMALTPSLAAEVKDLGTTLGGIKELSTYFALVKKYPSILLQLPSYAGVTIIAPSNDAFKNIPYTALNDIWDPDNQTTTVPLLQYHMLPGTVAMGALEAGPNVIRSTLLSSPQYTNITSGQKVIINKAGDDTVVLTTSMGTRCTVTKSDIPYSGGLIHIVDNLLVPPAQLRATSDAFQIPNFLGALFAADIMPDLAVRKNITVFAPLDKAMREVGGSLLDIEDDKDGKAALRRIMGYHIVHDQVLVSSDLTNGSTLSTLAPGPAGSNDTLDLTVHVAGNNKYINSAQIVQPDILLANGIMHIVSDVVNPDADVQPDPQANTQPVLFPVSSVEAPFTSDLPCTVSCPVTSTAEPTTTADATSTFLATHTNTGLAPQATGHFAGVAVGALGLGAGMAWL